MLLGGGQQARRQAMAHRLTTRVHQSDARRRGLMHALRKAQMPVAPGAGVGQGFQRRRGAAEDHGRLPLLRAKYRGVPRRVAKAFLLFVRSVMFLVHHHDAELPERDEHCGARTDDDIGATVARCQPGLGALRFAHAGMKWGDPSRKARLKAVHQLRCEPDFGHQNQRLLAPAQGVRRDLQIDFGLAAAGDAFEQADREPPRRAQFAQHIALRSAGFRRVGGNAGRGRWCMTVFDPALVPRLAQCGAVQGIVGAWPLRQFGEQAEQSMGACRRCGRGAGFAQPNPGRARIPGRVAAAQGAG